MSSWWLTFSNYQHGSLDSSRFLIPNRLFQFPNELSFGRYLQSFKCLGWTTISAFVTRKVLWPEGTEPRNCGQCYGEQCRPASLACLWHRSAWQGQRPAATSLTGHRHTDEHFVQSLVSLNTGRGPFNFAFAVNRSQETVEAQTLALTLVPDLPFLPGLPS